MTAFERYEAWWAGLDDDERAELLSTHGEISERIAASLRAAGIVVITAELDGDAQRTVFLLPGIVADFLDHLRDDSSGG